MLEIVQYDTETTPEALLIPAGTPPPVKSRVTRFPGVPESENPSKNVAVLPYEISSTDVGLTVLTISLNVVLGLVAKSSPPVFDTFIVQL
jgi:hypothetical protein